MVSEITNLLIELFDAIFSFIIIGFILAKFSFPWNIFLIGILILPFGIGIFRAILAHGK